MTEQNKKAFTLAEVLITLGIIGVVAAMTLPTLIQKHQKETYVTGFKRGVAVVDNMFKKMQADEDVTNFRDSEIYTLGSNCYYSSAPADSCQDFYGDPTVFERIIPKYLKTVKVCKASECDVKYSYSNDVSSVALSNYQRKITKVDYSNLPTNSTLHDIFYRPSNLDVAPNSILGFYANDGAIYYIVPGGPDVGVVIGIDSNGEKGPNLLGRDLIVYNYHGKSEFYITQNGDGGFANAIVADGWKMNY